MVLDNGPAAITAGMVTVACLAIAAASWRATVRTGNPNITYVTAAFLLLGVKNLVKALDLLNGTESGLAELGFSLTDLVAVGLIAWPLLAPRKVRA
ncbi:MAG: DUF5985 family protein [Halobacteriales archaeon]|nr:DUF5985 family protein [Halobacteriales archaeon]